MLKRISVVDLRIGMYIDEFCGSWMDHPFWRAHFVVDNELDLERIQDSGVTEVWIDASKGLDVDSAARAQQGREDAHKQIEERRKNAPCAKPPHPTSGARHASALSHATGVLAD